MEGFFIEEVKATIDAEKIVIVACAAGLDTVDRSFAVLKETKGYRRECTRAKDLGLPVGWATHPSQIETAKRGILARAGGGGSRSQAGQSLREGGGQGPQSCGE